MQVYDSLSELVGNTPLLRLRSVTRGMPGPQVLAKVEYFNPGGSVKDRIALRMVAAAEASGAAAAGRHDRGAHVGQHRSGAGDRRRRTRLPVRLRLPGQGGAGQDQRAARLRRRGGGLSRHGRARPSGLLLQRRAPDGGRDTRRLAARPVREPGEPGLPLRHHRPGDLVADRRDGDALRGRDRHRRHDHRHRAVPEGGIRRRGAGDRRRPGRIGLLRRIRPPVPGRGRGRGHLARHLRPGGVR